MRYVLVVILLVSSSLLLGQPKQTHRYELEKTNTDRYLNVLPAGDKGVFIFRDINAYKKGDVFNVIALDSTLNEKWNVNLSIDANYVFQSYQADDSKLYFLFRKGEFERNDYHLITIGFEDTQIISYDIQNEISIQLSEMVLLPNGFVLGGYVDNSSTVLLYTLGNSYFTVLPGFFQNTSNIFDIKDNGNWTFNVVTLNTDYVGNYLNLKTYSHEGSMLFERDLKFDKGINVLAAKSGGFIDGNLVIAGTYGRKNSDFASGIFASVVKPDGQENTIKYHHLFNLDHYFDYMKPTRAKRVKAKYQQKHLKGKKIKYHTKLLLNRVTQSTRGYSLSAEIFTSREGSRNLPPRFGGLASQDVSGVINTYIKGVPSKYHNYDVKYLGSVVMDMTSDGDLISDGGLKIEDLNFGFSIFKEVTAVSIADEKINMLYLSGENIHYKQLVSSEMAKAGQVPLMLSSQKDEILSTFENIGKGLFWYENNFLVWGYHRVGNNGNVRNRNRNVLYVNKVVFN